MPTTRKRCTVSSKPPSGHLPCAMRISPIRAIWMWMYTVAHPGSPAAAGRLQHRRRQRSGRRQRPGRYRLMGVVDNSGLAVSFIQSIYHEFGSGVKPRTPGSSGKTARPSASTCSISWKLAPCKQPFHTLNPAAARLNDGRCWSWLDGRRRSAANAGACATAISCRGCCRRASPSALVAGRTASPPIH